MPALTRQARLTALERITAREARHIDLALQFEEHERIGDRAAITGRVSAVFGGRLDKWSGKYDGSAGDVLRLPASRGQLDFLESGSAHVLAVGGRGGGKSVAAKCAAMALALAHPRALGLVVAPTHRTAQILYSKLLADIPQAWIYKIRRAPQEREIWLVNGAKIKFFSADNPDSIRGWDAEWALIDESQDISDEAVGITMLCLRVTDEPRLFETGTPKGGSDFHGRFEALQGDDDDGETFRFPSRDNPFIPLRIFDLAKKQMSPKLYAQEVEAQWIEDGEFVYELFDKKIHARHWRDRKDVLKEYYGDQSCDIGRDITYDICKRRFNHDAEYVIELDFNVSPMVAIVHKVLSSPRAVSDILWAVQEVVLDEEASADRMAKALKAEGFADSVIVADASDARAKSYYRQLRNARFKVVTPVKRSSRNPMVRDRVNAFSAKLLNAENETTYFVDPEKCPRLVRALSKHQRDDKGKPLPDQFSHYCDATGYAVVRLFPITAKHVVSGRYA